MLDDYKELQFYEYAKKLTEYFHAYIFEVDDITTSFPVILAFAKMIICPNRFTNNSKCSDCNICHLIDNNYYQDLKIVVPDGQFIKKEQISKLQSDLSLKSVNNTNQVYIIKEAEKMNTSASNSLLKFLEEPEIGIHGILITTNKNMLLKTIISRCQIINIKTNQNVKYDINDINNAINIVCLIDTKKEKSIAYLKKDILNIYKDKNEIIKILNIIEEIIFREINYRYEITDKNFVFYDIINSSFKEINLNNLINYLDMVILFKGKLIECPNLNLNLLLDRMIISISKVVL